MDSVSHNANVAGDVIQRLHSALKELLPAMVADGGGAEFVSYNDGVATFKLLGTCDFCPSRQLSAMALKQGIEDRVPEVADVRVLFPAFSQRGALAAPP
ncbi:MAG TPA: NifU family protein [Pyrinomonadaceae bacterium]|jgi:Fe-S cluster biogenesis protein NfuA|nr:NifU family protein [Pyrinomonadaceae bacterium]